MDIVLWALQIITGLLFAVFGYSHWLAYERTKVRVVWLAALPPWSVPIIGILDLAGGIGMVLPAATHVAVWLTPLAAALSAALMACAIVFHLIRGEYRNIVLNAVLGILAAVVAYGRYVVAPFSQTYPHWIPEAVLEEARAQEIAKMHATFPFAPR